MEVRSARALAGAVAWGRVALGATAVVAPALVARPWIGDMADGTTSRLLARTMGGRDLALGLGALRALAVSDQEARPWVALGGSADGVDALATVLAFGALPRRSRWGILALTTGAALVSIKVAESLDAPGAVTDEGSGAGPAADTAGVGLPPAGHQSGAGGSDADGAGGAG